MSETEEQQAGSSSAADVAEPEDSGTEDIDVEALDLIGQGKRNLVVGDPPAAVQCLQDACALLAGKYGETADECGEAYYQYGCALLELASMENGVLGNALQGVPDESADSDEEEEEGEAPKPSNVELESADKLEDKEREEVIQQVQDALEATCESEESGKEEKEKEGDEAEGKEEEMETEEGGDNKEMVEKEEEEKDESVEKDGEQKDDGKVEVQQKIEEKTEEPKVEKQEEKEKGMKEEEEKAPEKTKEVKEENAEKAEVKDDTKVTNDDTKVTNDDTKVTNDTKDVEQKQKDEEKENKDDKDKSEKKDEDDGAGPSMEKGEGEDKEKEEGDDISNFQLAWEMLELARVIIGRQESKDCQLKVSQIHLKLGELGLETEQYAQSVIDFNNCLDVQKRYLDPESRQIAGTHYNLGLAYSFANRFDESVTHYRQSKEMIEKRLADLEQKVSQAEGKGKEKADEEDPLVGAQKEIEELKELLPDVVSKLEDAKEMKVQGGSCDGAGPSSSSSSGFAASSSGFAASTLSEPAQQIPVKKGDGAKVSDISHLVRRKRKPEEEEDGASSTDPKRSRQDEGGKATPAPAVNGSGDAPIANGQQNGTAGLVNGTDGPVNGDIVANGDANLSPEKPSEIKTKKLPTDETPAAMETA